MLFRELFDGQVFWTFNGLLFQKANYEDFGCNAKEVLSNRIRAFLPNVECLPASKTVVIMRGLPGSGKSTTAKYIHNELLDFDIHARVLSTDNYFETTGKYIFDRQKLGAAHAWNQSRVYEALKNGVIPIVDNTNTTIKEMQPYIDMAKEYGFHVVLVEPSTEWAMDIDECFKRNTHNVPMEAIKAMIGRYQPTNTLLDKIYNYLGNKTTLLGMVSPFN